MNSGVYYLFYIRCLIIMLGQKEPCFDFFCLSLVLVMSFFQFDTELVYVEIFRWSLDL